MQFSYYKKPIIISIVSLAISILIFIFNPPDSTPYTPLIPVDDAVFEILILLIILPITGILGSFIIGYLLVPIYLFVHVKIIGRKLEYGFLEMDTPKNKKFKKSFQSFFPILLAVNISLILASNQEFMSIIVYPDHQVNPGDVNPIGFIFLLMYTVGISMGLFSAAWFIIGTGIIYSNKKKVEKTGDPVEIRSVGGFFKSLLKGYAGISVILSFINYLVFLTSYWQSDLLINILMQIAIPVLITCFNTLTMMILDITKGINKKYVRFIAKNLGVVDNLEITISKK